MYETVITVVGNVGTEPRQRVVAGGAIVADFRVASTPRRYDKSSGTWSDAGTTWYRVTCWRALAEHSTQSLKKGDRVIVTGRLDTKTWVSPQGEERSSLEIEASAIGFDLSRGPAVQQRVPRDPEAVGAPEESAEPEHVADVPDVAA